jgi:ATP-dependent Clp protease ATP-binding subunit ClpC
MKIAGESTNSIGLTRCLVFTACKPRSPPSLPSLPTNDLSNNLRERPLVLPARYEASQYGSPYIETEHLLLGLLREDQALVRMFLGLGNIRADIEQQITQRERVSTSVEVPLTVECKKVLNLASEEVLRLSHRYVGTEHVLLGMLRVEGSLAARLLQARGLKAAAIRERVARDFRSSITVDKAPGKLLIFTDPDLRDQQRRTTLEKFFSGLKISKSEDLIDFFAKDTQLTDASGERWDRDGILQNFENLFAPYTKNNSAPVVEGTIADGELSVIGVQWQNSIRASEQRIWVHRMSVVMIRENEEWRILLMHVTPVQPL